MLLLLVKRLVGVVLPPAPPLSLSPLRGVVFSTEDAAPCVVSEDSARPCIVTTDYARYRRG